MFIHLLIFEIKNRICRLSTLVYFLLFLVITFVLSVSFAGAFKGVNIGFGFSNKLALNTPVIINFIITFLGYFGFLVIAPIFGQSINKDFENHFNQILFSTPISKRTYFWVRYLGSFISSMLIMSSLALGIWIATYMPFIDRTFVNHNHLGYYIAPYITSLGPNFLIFGAIFFFSISVYKKMAPVYIASIVVFTGSLISQTLTTDLENKTIAAMIDPLGLDAAMQIIRYWSVSEQSTNIISLKGIFLYNRLFWGSVGLFFLILSYHLFNPFKLPKDKKAKLSNENQIRSKASIHQLDSTRTNTQSYKIFLELALFEFKQAFSNIYFLIILLCGIIYIFAISGQIGKIYGTETLLVTYHVLEILGNSFRLFIIILTTFYAGELVWKDRDYKFFELVDAKPVSNIFLYFSKFISLILIQLFLLVTILICCVIVQTFNGYYNYEWPIYFKRLFFYSFIPQIFNCIFILFIHSIVTNKYVGHTVVIILYSLFVWLPNFSFDHYLYLVGRIPVSNYSDMNGFGTSLYPFTIIGTYWGFFHIILLILTILLWKRGLVHGFKYIVSEFKRRLSKGYKQVLITLFFSWVLMGGFIFYNTNILNIYETQKSKELSNVVYEKTYKHFEKVPQLEIISINTKADVYPNTQSLIAKSELIYKNKATIPLDKLMINYNPDLNYCKLSWSKTANIIEENKHLGVIIYKFEKPVMPNEEINLSISSGFTPKGFANHEFSKKIVQNGTFFYGHDFLPTVGYLNSLEITDEKTRRKYKLPKRPRMPSIHDQNALKKTYISSNGTWINFEAIISTSKDQIGVAPGYLIKEWTEQNRKYFHYKMDRPMLNFFCILSARYEVVKERFANVSIEIYHHKGHDTNNKRMINSVKKSLDYFNNNFSPYQFKQFRILEFPRYQLFAQSFPNTIPYSEKIGFIAKVKDNDPENIDYPFYVTAHELAHQWWAHQVIGGNLQGTTMLSESLAQYSALMVQEKEFGPKHMKKFLKYELDKYLYGRSKEELHELPLSLNENQQYIHYNKGSLIFYALKDYLGEEVVNRVLKNFIKDYAFKDAPFPRSIDLVERFKKVTPSDKQYLIKDFFETITLYDNRTDKISYKKENNQFKVTITGHSKKIQASELGIETEVPMNDLIDVGLFDKDGNLIYLKKHLVKSGENTFEILLDQAPFKGGIDPINKLIDKVSDDNSIRSLEIM